MQIRMKWPNQFKNVFTNISKNIIWHLIKLLKLLYPTLGQPMEGGGGGLKETTENRVGLQSVDRYIPCTGNTPYINSMLLRNVNKLVCVGHSILLSLYSLPLRVQCKQFSIYVRMYSQKRFSQASLLKSIGNSYFQIRTTKMVTLICYFLF